MENIDNNEFELWKERKIKELEDSRLAVSTLSDLLSDISTELNSQIETIKSSADIQSAHDKTNVLATGPIEAASQDARAQLADLLQMLKVKTPQKNQ